ncbi:MAG: thiamine-phosphate kinase [Rhodospirillaceae bacterium]
MSGLSEFALIDTLLKPLAGNAPGAFALTDDAAVLPAVSLGEVLVITKDALAAGVHFLSDDPPGDMARKALRTNLSDLAAMGAEPVGFFMALCLGQETSEGFVRDFVEGLTVDVEHFDVPLMGGDIIRHPGPFIVSITAVGKVRDGSVLRRNGAEAGHHLWVSGTIGDGALGLLAARGELENLSTKEQSHIIARYRVPEPRLALGKALVGVASACIDVSDGLISDAAHLAHASGLACHILQSAVPLSSAARADLQTNSQHIETILTGGDDYELLFAAPSDAEDTILAMTKQAGVNVCRIGEFTTGTGVHVVDDDGIALEFHRQGYQHS